MASIKRRSNWSLRRKDCTQDEESLTGASSSRNRSSKIPKDLFNSFLKEVKRYEFEDKYQQWSREEKEAASQAWAWPADDLSIQVIPHASRFAENPLPPSLRRAKTRGVKPYILQSVEYFTADQTRIRRAYADDIPVQDLKRQGAIVASLRTREMCPISGSTALGEEKNDEPPPSPSSHSPASLPVQVNEQLVKDCEHVATLSQSNQRVALFQTYAGAYQNLPKQPMDRLYPSEGESSGPAVEFIVEPAEISFELGAVEPFLGSLALYNFAKKKKISETYYFHCNERGVLNLVQDKDQLPEFMPAIFRLSHSSPDVFFILRVEKILQGDVETVAEPYLKYDTIRAKDKEKYVTAVTAAAGRYTMWQPFGWAVAPLLNEDNAIPDSITFKPIYRTREQDIQDVSLITSHSEGKGSSKKMKSIPGRCVVRIKQIPPSDVVPGRLSPSLVPLKPTADRGFREIQEFALSPALTPYTEYVNDMFLYLESANLSARTGSPSAKDIAVQVKLLDSDADIHAEGLPVMYAPGRNALVSSVTTPVTYHNKSPHFYSEIKVALPAVLHATHHLVFTFYQVNVQPTKSGKSGGVTVPVAYAFWQIYPNDRVVSKDTLPIYTEVSAGYLSEEAAGDLKTIDGGKPLLTVRNKLYSTIYTQDINMNNVLRRMKTITATTKMDAALKPLDLLMKVHAVRIVKYFPVLMNYIFKLLSASSAHTTQVFSVIPEILVSINEANPNHTFALLRGYSDNTFDLCEANEKGDYIHDILVREWLVYVRDSPLDCEVLLKHSSFLFKIIFKSMVLKIYDTGELNDATTRKTRFTTEFGDNLRSLVVVLAWEVYQRNKSALTLCKDLARNIAAFCNDLFAVADRAVVLEAIELFLYQLNSDSVMNDFKFEFLRVLLEYEHFLALSLPRSSVAGLPPMSETMAFFQERHYLAALIIRDLGQHLQQDNKSNRIKAMDVVRRAFTSYDYDEALQRAPEKHKQAITVFFPLLGLIVDHPLASDTNPVLEEQRDLMICFLYLLKHCDNGLLQQWFKRQAIGDIKRFFATVYSCIQSFQFMERWEWVERMTESSEIKSSSAMKESIESFYSAGGIPKRTTFRQQRAEAKAKEAEGSGEERAFKRTLNRKNTGSRDISQAADYRENLESNLSTEAMFVLTDAVKVYLDILTEEDCNSQLFEKVCTFITTMLMHKQSIDFLQSFFAFLRFFVEKFGLLLFQDSSFLGQICFHVMNYCNSSHAATRQQASALLFLLMQKHHRCFPAQFQRIAVHITVAVSRLVGRGLKGQTDSYLKSSLSAVLEYAAMDKDHGEALSESVKDLVERLFMVLQDNMKISEHSDDPDMMADLYCRLAHGYINAPSLRITWLESLGNFHSRRGRFAESAMCNLHIAAMIAEYLNVVRPQPGLPHGCSTFLPISPNVLEETAIRDTSVITEDNDESGVFTEDKLVDFLTHTVEELKAGDLFEMAADVYGALLPIHQKNLQFTLMQTAHSQLSQIYGDIVECMASQRRMLGSYYRVGFYGDAFEELNKMEFIYKEPKITKLVEIKDRLHKLYQAKLAGVEVKIIVHSNTVNTDELDATTAYIQITSVEPYFDPNELESRKTAFAQKVSLQRFIYVTPFTKQGKARTESVADQYIRKTILETERQFPYLRTRLPVIEKKLIELNPLEHTIAEVQKQTARILRESHAQNPSLKTLQPVLSGSVCLQVQAGPLEYSRVFFLERAEEWQKEQLEELRRALLKFLEACQVGIEQHAALCETENDSAFQANLEAGYADTEKKMKDHYNKFMLLSQSFTV